MRPTVRFIAFLAPIAYAGMIIGALLHEVGGHGLTALALGGTFSGFTVRWDASGLAEAYKVLGAPLWHEIAIVSAGIVVTTVIGFSLCAYAHARKVDTARGAVCAIVGAFVLMSGLDYVFWSGLQRNGPGDPSRVLQLIQKTGAANFEAGRTGLLVASAILALAAQWWGVRLALRHIETRLGNGAPLRRQRRAVAAGVLAIAGSVAYLAAGYDDAIPGSGWVPGCVGALSLIVTAALVSRFPLAPFSMPFAITGKQLIGAWLALALIAACVHFWWNDGVNWDVRGAQRSIEVQSIVDRLRDAKDKTAVEALAARVETALVAHPNDDDQARDLLTTLGFAWGRVRDHERALACFERLGREFPDQRSIALILQLSVLHDRGDLDAAASRTQAFLASNVGRDWNIGVHMLAMVEEERGNWAEALAAAEQWVPEGLDDPYSALFSRNVRSNLLSIARCKVQLGRTAEALGGLETRLSDRRAPFSADIAIAYAEIAGRSGQIEEARRFLAGLPAENRDACNRSLAIVEAWQAKDPVTLLRLFSDGDLDEKDAAGRLLGELGAPALQLLSERVAAGDVAAIEAAGKSRRTELIPLLEKRYQASKEGSVEEREASIALTNLEAQLRRPASRPASRSSK